MPLPTDPRFIDQWHLGNSVAGLFDLNVQGVWNPLEGLSYTGAGVRIVVIDDGFDYLHPDLVANYNQFLDYNYDGGTLDAFGNPATNWHGTSVAGIIGADDNGVGTVGIAHDASLVGYRVHSFINDLWLTNIRDAIAQAATNAQADVTNISQGIGNDTASEFGFGYNAARFDEIETSIGTAVDTGRGGLGMTIVKSAGNSRAANYDVNADDWTNDTRQVVVGAVDQNGFVSSYSSYGSALLVSAFGTPGQVLTTDRTGVDGYSADDDNPGFNGTSAAAPMVAGIVALMYEANPDLGWRDVQSILAASARHVGSAVDGVTLTGSERHAWNWNDADNWNGGGMHFSNDYGYGLVDALAAVRLAESWLVSEIGSITSNEVKNIIDVLDTAVVIPDGNATGTTFSGAAAFNDVVERVTVTMTFSTTYTADLEVYLTSPDGTVSLLIRDTGAESDFSGVWTFETQAFRGEDAAGTWQVRIVDDNAIDVLNVTDIVITTFGEDNNIDRYVYTDAYSTFAGVGNHVTALADVDGGIDTVNAAAVTTGSLIDLQPGTIGQIAGQAFSVAMGSVIENALGGDGADTLRGNDVGNTLLGARGQDLLEGRDGGDQLIGGDGADTLIGGTGADAMTGGAGDDTFHADQAGDVVTEAGGAGTDRVISMVSWVLGANLENLSLSGASVINGTGNDLANVIAGNAAANILDGKIGADRLVGKAGDDTYYVDDAADVVVEAAGEGIDRVVSTLTWTLGAEVENLSLGGAATINGTGNALANVIAGNAAANILDGKAGADKLKGGAGNDTYYVDNAGDLVTELAAGGTDRVVTTVTHTLAVEVENLSLGGLSAINGTGNALANVIVGNTAANVLDGLGGADQLRGGAGNDTYVIDDVGDVVTELTGEGTDLVRSGVTFVTTGTAIGVENITLTGSAAINAGGNDLNNVIIGNGGANVIIGGLGRDTMTGGAGIDRFKFSSTAESTSAAYDWITDLTNTDRIDLSTIDADVGLAGNQSFVLVDAFSNQAGQVMLTYSVNNDFTILSADVNGDGVADMRVVIYGDHDDFTNFAF